VIVTWQKWRLSNVTFGRFLPLNEYGIEVKAIAIHKEEEVQNTPLLDEEVVNRVLAAETALFEIVMRR
jgi:hypothetical protein